MSSQSRPYAPPRRHRPASRVDLQRCARRKDWVGRGPSPHTPKCGRAERDDRGRAESLRPTPDGVDQAPRPSLALASQVEGKPGQACHSDDLRPNRGIGTLAQLLKPQWHELLGGSRPSPRTVTERYDLANRRTEGPSLLKVSGTLRRFGSMPLRHAGLDGAAPRVHAKRIRLARVERRRPPTRR